MGSKLVLGTAALLALCMLASLVWSSKLLNAAFAELEAKVGWQIYFQECELSFPLRLRVSHLRLYAPSQGEVKVKELTADVSIRALLRQEVPFSRLVLDSPEIRLGIDRASAGQLPRFPARLKYVQVKNAQLRLTDLATSHYLQVNNANFRLQHDSRHHKFLLSGNGAIWTQGSLLPVPYIRADLHLDAQVETGSKLVSQGRVDVANFEADGFNVEQFSANFEQQEEQLTLEDLQLQLDTSWAVGSLQLDMVENWPFRAQIATKELSLYDLISALGVRPCWIDMPITGAVRLEGDLLSERAIQGSLEAEVGSLVLKEGPRHQAADVLLSTQGPISVTSRLEIDASGIHFLGAQLTDGQSRAEGNCTLFLNRPDDIDLQMSFSEFDFATVQNKIVSLEYEGRGAGWVRVAGPYRDLKIESHVKLDDFSFEGIQLGGLSGQVHYEDDQLAFSQLRTSPNPYLNGDLSIAFGHPDMLHLRIQADGLVTDHLYQQLWGPRFKAVRNWLIQLQPHGKTEVDVKMQAPLSDGFLGALQGNLLVRSAELKVMGLQLSSLAADFFAGEQDNRLNAHLKGPDASLSLDGLWRKDGSGLKGQINLERLDTGKLASGLGGMSLSALASGALNVGGTLQHPKANGQFKLLQGSLGQVHFDDLHGWFGWLDDELNLTAQSSPSGLLALANLKASEKREFEVKVTLPYGPLSSVITDAHLEAMQVQVGAEANFLGDLNDGVHSGQVQIFPLTLLLGETRWRLDEAAEINLAKNEAHLKTTQLKSQQGDWISASGVLTPQASDLKIKSHAALGSVWVLDPSLSESTGIIKLDADVKGDVAAPQIFGTLALLEGRFVWDALDAPMTNVLGQAEFKGDQVVLHLEAQKEKGRLEGTASVQLHGLEARDGNLQISIKDLPIGYKNLAKSQVSGNLELEHWISDPLLKGALTLDKPIVSGNVSLDSLLGSSSTQRVRRFGLSSPLKLDVSIKPVPALVVDTPMLKGTWLGSITLLGSLRRPGALGQWRLENGEARVSGQAYAIQKARVDFDDPHLLDPNLDVEARTQIGDVIVFANVHGSLSRPTLDLMSQPSLPESDLLSLVSLGFVLSDVKDFAKTAQAKGLEALSNFTGMPTWFRSMSKGSSAKISELRLASSFSKSQGVSVPALRFGVEVMKGLSFRMETTLVENESGQREQQIELEHNFSNRARWRLNWDSEGYSNYGDAGFDFWYRWEWN